VARNNLSPQILGDEGDHGTSMLQRIPFVGLTSTGGFAWTPIPEQFGPRNCGQLGVDALMLVTRITKRANQVGRMFKQIMAKN
jgi:hypothetical protein